MQPIADGTLLLIKVGPLVEAECKQNMAAVLANLASLTDAQIDAGPCPRFDRYMRAYHLAQRCA